jgi:hypothetical protein
MECNQYNAIASLTGLFVGVALGLVPSMIVNHAYLFEDAKEDTNENEIQKLKEEMSDLVSVNGHLLCDYRANAILIDKLKHEVMRLDKQVSDYRMLLRETYDNAHILPPPSKLRKRYRTVSGDGSVTPPRNSEDQRHPEPA